MKAEEYRKYRDEISKEILSLADEMAEAASSINSQNYYTLLQARQRLERILETVFS